MVKKPVYSYQRPTPLVVEADRRFARALTSLNCWPSRLTLAQRIQRLRAQEQVLPDRAMFRERALAAGAGD